MGVPEPILCWCGREFALHIAILLVVLLGISPQQLRAQLKTTSSGERTASAVGFNCTTDKCSESNTGCASCARLGVELPANAWVVKTHCYTTANYPDDYSRHDPHEVACGADNSWSLFDSTSVVATNQHVLVKTTYHNRSHNRSRDVRLDVEWLPFELVQSDIVLPSNVAANPIESLTPQLNRELVDEVLWSIAHEGCDVFAGDRMRPLSELRKCYASTQKGPEASARINATSADDIKAATLRAIARSLDEYAIQINFDWVMDHEGRREEFVGLAKEKNFKEIRSIYKHLQAHNDKAFNALSAISDSQIDNLVHGRNLGSERVENNQVPGETSIALTDHIEWSIIYGGCPAFSGESILPAEKLRTCFLGVQRDNHNGEAWDLLKRASPNAISLATERAITKVKEQYPVGQLLNHFLIKAGELDHFKGLISAHEFDKTRRIYASAHKQAAGVPFLLYALADSEIASVVNQYRLDVEIPSDTSADDLESIAPLVDTQKVNLSPTTTESSLADVACGGGVSFDFGPIRVSASQSCRTLVRRAAAKQGLTISAAGTVTGGDAIELPTLPRLGVPTLVTFRADVSSHTAEAALSSSGTKFAPLQPARLIQPEHGTKLSADTVKNYGDNGLQWYASAIAANRIRQTDLSLTGLIRVGIVDAGVDTAHPTLTPFFWKLPMALPNIPWQKGSIGYDYVNEVSDPAEDTTPDVDGNLESHGTHVAGLVTARGLASWLEPIKALSLEEHVKVYCLKIAQGADGNIPDFTFPGQALTDSLPNQIHLINLSLEGPRSPFIRDDIAKHSSDALLVLAAGNDQKDLNDQKNLHFNGTFRNDDGTPVRNVIIVAALMDDGTLTPDSNRGDIAVQIAAPGNNIYSTVQGGGFDVITGTSQAAPLVTSTAAILLAEHDAYPSAIKDRILATCDWDDALKTSHVVAEGCKLNMAKAIVSQTDIVELVPHDKGVPPKWLRGTVKKDQFQLVDDQGQTIDPQEIQRMWFSDRDGNVRVAVQGSGHKPSKLALSKIVITLDPGEQCPTGSNPCEIDSKVVQDIVFRWKGQ